ncbi:hypothetical protein [Halorubrum sp. CSM-61]|uniref:hypothetical protein n=1 Tax=Halorubrum sp. CSM-61 TaxID=2485838 RepID=UPI000F4D0B2E|nr:hypothetical protein [Halorubrum sp. CSM-61]
MPTSLSYWTIQPDRWTFNAQKLRDWVESQLDGRVLNACAGRTQLTHNGRIVRNDINPEIDADYHVDVRDLPDILEAESFDMIVLDPPFSEQQNTTTYDREDDTLPTITELASVVDALLKPGGRVIRLGYTTTLMPPGEEYLLEEVTIWNTLGRQHDWLGTVAQKPDNETASATRPVHVTDAAVPNAGATASGGVATSGNGNTPLSLEYIRLSPEIMPQDGVADYLATHLSGRVLDVSTYERSLSHDGHLVQTSVDESVDAAYHFDERELAAEFAADIFHTVVVDLPSEAFQQTTNYGGRTTGRDTALKQELHPLIAAGGQIFQVGHTATCMPQRLDYRRSRVAVIEHPCVEQDWIISIDMKQNTGLDVHATDRSPLDIHVPDSDAEAQHSCIRCGEGWYLHPSWYVDCPTCGARPENYCVTDDDTILYRPHSERLDYLEEHHNRHECDPGVTSRTPSTLSTDQEDDSTTSSTAPTEQESLEQFASQKN